MSRPTYTVTVSREDGYWIGQVARVRGATVETRRLDHLEDEVRDGLALLLDVDADGFDLAWRYDLPDMVAAAVEDFRRASTRLTEAEDDYPKVSRRAAYDLERAHVSRRDAAALLGVSYQRVQQLADDAKRRLVDA